MNELPRYLKPGHLIASDQALRISTVLGSCVAVCLFDRRRQWGGINHFLLSRSHDVGDRTTRFGDVATSALVGILTQWGSHPGDLAASIIGAASMEDVDTSVLVARENAAVARSVLSEYGIPVVYEETGGTRGRRLVFHNTTGLLESTLLPQGAGIE